MEITRRTDYGLRLLLRLAQDGNRGPVSVRELAEQQQVPYAFARSIQRDLVRAGLIATKRGSGGGVSLAVPAERVTLLDVVVATQGEVSCSVCTSDPNWCGRMGGCSVHKVWQGVDDCVRGYLGGLTLAQIVGDQGR